MRHHFHRCAHLRVISVPASKLHGARRGGGVILDELCDAKKLTPCLGLAECDVLTTGQKQALLVERATRIREQEGRPVELSGVRRERGAALRELRDGLVAERDRIQEENLRIEAEMGGAEDHGGIAARSDELSVSGLSVRFDDALAAMRIARLDEIDRALEAMADPIYGTCVLCGREVEIGRLGRHPDTRVCTACARETPEPSSIRIQQE